MTQSLLDDNQDHLNVDLNKNYLEELVGDDKKFKSVEALARGKFEADQFIEMKNEEFDNLKKDYLKLREEYQAVPRLQELIDQMEQRDTNANREQNNQDSKVQDKAAIDITEIENLLQKKLQQHEDAKKEQENFNRVMSKIKEKWGDNYNPVLKQKMETLGLDKDFVDDLARKRPALLLKTLEIDQQNQQQSFDAPMRNQQRSDNFAPSTNKRTWSYYQAIKKKNPSLYLDPKTQTQMLKDRSELGEAFKDGDYNT